MANTSDLIKEEFTQNYLQYRWLDDTRTKLIDRFFILAAGVSVARFQFSDFLRENWGWLTAMHLFFAITSIGLARTIILFRRQQRGHGQYINSLRASLISALVSPPTPADFVGIDINFANQYSNYLHGHKVYLTTWVEFVVILIASATPFLLTDIVNVVPKICNLSIWFTYIVSAVFALFIFYRLVRLWKRYNFNDTISWDKE